jgi:hypothetical protein
VVRAVNLIAKREAVAEPDLLYGAVRMGALYSFRPGPFQYDDFRLSEGDRLVHTALVANLTESLYDTPAQPIKVAPRVDEVPEQPDVRDDNDDGKTADAAYDQLMRDEDANDRRAQKRRKRNRKKKERKRRPPPYHIAMADDSPEPQTFFAESPPPYSGF